MEDKVVVITVGDPGSESSLKVPGSGFPWRNSKDNDPGAYGSKLC
jgi:hypothetical protein